MDMLQYVNRDTFLHRLNPLTKFIFFVLMALLTSFTKSGPAVLFLFVSLSMIWTASGIIKEMLSLFAKLKILMLFIIGLWIILGAFRVDVSPVLYRNDVISFEVYDLYKGFVYALRVFLMVSTFFTVIVTTNFSEIILGLRKIKMPYSVAFGVGLVFQMIPIVTNEFHTIMQAQSSRGLEVENCGVVEKIKNYVTVSIPLLFRIIGKGQGISLAMYYYKLNFKVRRTSFKNPPTTGWDYAFLALSVALTVAGVLISIYLPGYAI